VRTKYPNTAIKLVPQYSWLLQSFLVMLCVTTQMALMINPIPDAIRSQL